jgi:hypothetical protein
MNKNQLKELIAECVNEVYQEQQTRETSHDLLVKAMRVPLQSSDVKLHEAKEQAEKAARNFLKSRGLQEATQDQLNEAFFDAIKNLGRGSVGAIQSAWKKAKELGDKDEQTRLEKQLAAVKSREPSTFEKIKKGLGGMLDTDGYQITTPHPDSDRAERDRKSALNKKQGKFQDASDSEKGNLNLKAQVSIEKLKNKFEDEVKKILRNAYIEGESVGMTRLEVTKAFRAAMTGIFNKYKTLEEIADE